MEVVFLVKSGPCKHGKQECVWQRNTHTHLSFLPISYQNKRLEQVFLCVCFMDIEIEEKALVHTHTHTQIEECVLQC